MVNTRELTSEGNEKNFATNTLGTHVLTTKLIPILQKVFLSCRINKALKQFKKLKCS